VHYLHLSFRSNYGSTISCSVIYLFITADVGDIPNTLFCLKEFVTYLTLKDIGTAMLKVAVDTLFASIGQVVNWQKSPEETDDGVMLLNVRL